MSTRASLAPSGTGIATPNRLYPRSASGLSVMVSISKKRCWSNDTSTAGRPPLAITSASTSSTPAGKPES
jgi:hypothetical protein